MSDLDPAAIMAEHQPRHDPRASVSYWCPICAAPHPCLTYRLAADLAERDAQIAIVRATWESWRDNTEGLPWLLVRDMDAALGRDE